MVWPSDRPVATPCAPKTTPYAATATPTPAASRMIARRSAGQSEVTG